MHIVRFAIVLAVGVLSACGSIKTLPLSPENGARIKDQQLVITLPKFPTLEASRHGYRDGVLAGLEQGMAGDEIINTYHPTLPDESFAKSMALVLKRDYGVNVLPEPWRLVESLDLEMEKRGLEVPYQLHLLTNWSFFPSIKPPYHFWLGVSVRADLRHIKRMEKLANWYCYEFVETDQGYQRAMANNAELFQSLTQQVVDRCATQLATEMLMAK